MVAEKIDIGSMGDYPLLINGSKTQANERARTELVSVTGYSPTGALNMVVVPPNSPVDSIADLDGQEGLRQRRLRGPRHAGPRTRQRRHRPEDRRRGAQPAAAGRRLGTGIRLRSQALSQFVAWPGLLVFQDKAKLLYDGAEGDYPTFHGVVVRRDYADQHPEVLDAFLQAQLDATDFLNENPLEAAKLVADGSGLPQEVVYLYNGPGGTSFDTTLKPSLIEALKGDVPYLKSIGDFADLDIDGFVSDDRRPPGVRRSRQGLRRRAEVDDQPVRDHAAATRSATSPSADPTLAGELWIDGKDDDPARREPRLPAARRPRGQRPTASRSAPPTSPTPSSAPAGSPTSRLGPGRPQLPAVRHARRRRSATPRAHPGATVVDYQQALAGAV